MSEHIDVPYLIVGAGPTGMTAARLLANAGRRCLVVERRDRPQPNPSAHVVNARTLEIFRHGKPVAIVSPAAAVVPRRWREARPVKLRGVSLT